MRPPKPGEPSPTPIWLSDSSYPAPCPCGRPIEDGEPTILGTGETGLTRVFHVSCIQPIMQDDDD